MLLFDLSERLKLRVTGSDRVRFLNGQMTNDVRKATADRALAACVVNAKGKLDAHVYLSAGPDELLLDAEPEVRATLPPRIERYVIADDVTIEEVTDDFALFHLIGENAPPLPNEGVWRQARRFGEDGWDLLVDAAEHDRVLALLAAEAPLCAADEAERLRIEAGIPRWGRELSDQIIPVEANLANETIDYAKGCYIGQEVISRMKMSGQTSKRLCGLVAIANAPLAAEWPLFHPETGKEVGRITSATRSERLGREIALGFVKRGSNEIGTRLSARHAEGETATVEVVELPFR